MLSLYAVTDRTWLKPGESLEEAAEKALRGGITILQYREKEGEGELLMETARKLKTLCSQYEVPFIINDDVNLALAVDADGVHAQRLAHLQSMLLVFSWDAGVVYFSRLHDERLSVQQESAVACFECSLRLLCVCWCGSHQSRYQREQKQNFLHIDK